MDWVSKFFEDKRFLGYITRLALIFGPGFLTLGYFERSTFLALDWLKLLMFCALFSVVFVMPTIFLIWFIGTFHLTRTERRLRRSSHSADSLNQEVELGISSMLQLKHVTHSSLERANLKALVKQAKEVQDEYSDLRKQKEELLAALIYKRGTAIGLLLRAWLLFFELFAIVIFAVGADYFGFLRLTLKQLLEDLTWIFIIINPLLAIGTGIMINRWNLTQNRLLRAILLLVGILMLIACLEITRRALFSTVNGMPND